MASLPPPPPCTPAMHCARLPARSSSTSLTSTTLDLSPSASGSVMPSSTSEPSTSSCPRTTCRDQQLASARTSSSLSSSGPSNPRTRNYEELYYFLLRTFQA